MRFLACRTVLAATFFLISANICTAQQGKIELSNGSQSNLIGMQTSFDFTPGSGTKMVYTGKLVGPYPPHPVTPDYFIDTGDIIQHTATGIRFPKSNAGCLIGAFEPISENISGPTSFSHGATIEYICNEADGLRYVYVTFEGSFKYLHDKGLNNGLSKLAFLITQNDSRTSRVPCIDVDYALKNPSSLLIEKECDVRWVQPKHFEYREISESKTYAFGRGSTFIIFTSTCYSTQCSKSIPEFDKFVETFDLTTMRDELSQ